MDVILLNDITLLSISILLLLAGNVLTVRSINRRTELLMKKQELLELLLMELNHNANNRDD